MCRCRDREMKGDEAHANMHIFQKILFCVRFSLTQNIGITEDSLTL